MLLRCRGIFKQWQNNILCDGRPRTVYTRVIGGYHHKKHHQRKQAKQTYGQNLPQSHRKHQLVIKGGKLLHFGHGKPFFLYHIFHSLKMRSIKVLFVRKRLVHADYMLLLRHSGYGFGEIGTHGLIRHDLLYHVV